MSYSQTHVYPQSGLIGSASSFSTTGLTTALTTATAASFVSPTLKAGVYSARGYVTVYAITDASLNSISFDCSGGDSYDPGFLNVVGNGIAFAVTNGTSINAPINTVFRMVSDGTANLQIRATFASGTFRYTAYNVELVKIG